ncbi:MAG: DUF2156 domain-containing protein [Synergistaceae bacterium]|nr:DUF2156 domain-containing protein [Synergistaceae bacterium]
MQFQPMKIQDVPLIQPFFEGLPSNTCDYTVGGMFMWRDYFQMEYAIEDGTLFSRLMGEDGRRGYNIPLGSRDMASDLRRLMDHAHGEKELIRFCTVPEEYLSAFRLPGVSLHLTSQTEYFDYLYLAEDFVGLSGEKYASQRNHIHQFLRFAPNWDYRDLDAGNLSDVLVFFKDYYQPSLSESPSRIEENRKTLEVLENLEQYRMRGGVLLVNGVVVGFSLCEVLGETLYVHIEKADREVPGAYPMLAWQSAKRYAGEGTGVRYINREEDMGDPGLRESKLAWHPVRLLEKYILDEEPE